jgi:hypothetical protein
MSVVTIRCALRNGRPLAPLLLLIALTCVAGLAFSPHPLPMPVPEEAQHLAAFAVLALLSRPAFPGASRIQLAIALVALGGAIELLQWAFTPRHAEWRDWASDAAGAALAIGLQAAWLRLISAVRRNEPTRPPGRPVRALGASATTPP